MPTRHGRGEWLALSRFGISGPSQDRNAVTNLIIHYTGGNTTVTNDLQMAQLLARINDQYWSDPNRGYAIGYNWGCAYHDGGLWNIRDHDIRCGANGCQPVNVPFVAILVPTPNIGAPPSAAQDNMLKNVWIPQLKSVYPNIRSHVYGHRDVRGWCGDGGSTACPGEPIYSNIRVNYYDTAGTSPPPPQTGEEEMDWFVKDGTNEWWVGTMTKRKLNPAHTAGNGWQRSLAALAKVLVDIPTGTAAQQATWRQWVASVPDGDFTADDGALTAIANAIALLAKTTHLEEVEQLVRKIPTTGVPGSGLTVPQLEEVLNRALVQVEQVPGNANIVVNES